MNPNAIKTEERHMNTALEARPPNRERRTKFHSMVQRVLVAVDLSAWSKATAIYAAGIARRFDAVVTLIHAFDPEGITKIAGNRVYDSLDDARRDAEKRLSGLVEEIRKFYPKCDMEFRIGAPAEQIETTALLLNADLVVIAGHHPASPLRFLAADQAQEISRNLSCPVLVYNGTETAATVTRKGQAMDGSAQPAAS
jgi:nucleotide-binding universal stress UspA family protein